MVWRGELACNISTGTFFSANPPRSLLHTSDELQPSGLSTSTTAFFQTFTWKAAPRGTSEGGTASGFGVSPFPALALAQAGVVASFPIIADCSLINREGGKAFGFGVTPLSHPGARAVSCCAAFSCYSSSLIAIINRTGGSPLGIAPAPGGLPYTARQARMHLVFLGVVSNLTRQKG